MCESYDFTQGRDKKLKQQIMNLQWDEHQLSNQSPVAISISILFQINGSLFFSVANAFSMYFSQKFLFPKYGSLNEFFTSIKIKGSGGEELKTFSVKKSITEDQVPLLEEV